MTSMNPLFESNIVNGEAHRERCGVCGRQPVVTAVSCPSPNDCDNIEDIEDIHIIQRRWPLCVSCEQAVWREVERASLHTPLRIATAVALVASVRSPEAHPAIWSARYWERMDRATQDKLAIRAVTVFFFWPVVVFMSAMALSSVLR